MLRSPLHWGVSRTQYPLVVPGAGSTCSSVPAAALGLLALPGRWRTGWLFPVRVSPCGPPAHHTRPRCLGTAGPQPLMLENRLCCHRSHCSPCSTLSPETPSFHTGRVCFPAHISLTSRCRRSMTWKFLCTLGQGRGALQNSAPASSRSPLRPDALCCHEEGGRESPREDFLWEGR